LHNSERIASHKILLCDVEGFMDADSVICSSVKECRELPDDTEELIEYGWRTISVKPKNCSGRHPHRYSREEDSPHYCSFVRKRVEAVRIYQKVFDY
jgi:hypothetical protein